MINNLQRTSANEIFAVLNNCGFHLHQCQPQSFLFNKLFLWVMKSNFDIIVYIIACENLIHPCKIARLKSYNAGRTICHHVIKFAGDLQIAEIVRRQYYW